MTIFDDETEQVINEAAERAAERAVGVYIEATMDEFQTMREAYDSINAKLDNFVTKDEFNELMADVRLNRLAIIETNKDLGKLEARVTKLENA